MPITHSPVTETESTVFEAGDRFAEATGADTEIAIASALSKELRTRSLVTTTGPPPDQWVLIASDGSHGTVLVDPDEMDESRVEVTAARSYDETDSAQGSAFDRAWDDWEGGDYGPPQTDWSPGEEDDATDRGTDERYDDHPALGGIKPGEGDEVDYATELGDA